jgi:exodeoxyribonuclease VII small subunit
MDVRREDRSMSEARTAFDFEAALAELEALVERMETGELGLEESLAAFERGVVLTRECQAALRDAELRVQALTAESGRLSLEPLDDDALEDADEE